MESADQNRCPHFCIATGRLSFPATPSPLRVPVYLCTLAAPEERPDEALPPVVFGADGAPVSRQGCTIARCRDLCQPALTRETTSL